LQPVTAYDKKAAQRSGILTSQGSPTLNHRCVTRWS
jgi:hypothetical protein